ncbi:MAG: PIG-L family deacetylase [Myxococcales bacterium]|nr:PIG-L family deacetylase [Myxococcales bacterium]
MDPRSPRPEDVSTDWILRPGGRPLFVFAHQDDETVMAGLIRRVVEDDARGRFVWWTNGDGLAPGTGMAPEAYGAMRVEEATRALACLGASEARKTDLWCSEIENYRRLTHVALGGGLAVEAQAYFRAEALKVEAAVRAADPDRVFVLAWQGGHPEHDLVHVMTARAVRMLRRETGRPIPIVQCPAYEYVIACALRFKPWFQGDVRRVTLSVEERAAKQAVFEAYPSQQALFQKFRAVVRVMGTLSALRGRRLSVEDYLGEEQLGVVPPEQDYTRSTHRWERLNYMLDDFEGIGVRFDTMVRPIAAALLG